MGILPVSVRHFQQIFNKVFTQMLSYIFKELPVKNKTKTNEQTKKPTKVKALCKSLLMFPAGTQNYRRRHFSVQS